MSSWHTYPKIWNLGHRAVRDLLTKQVYIEEKIDGSQASFGVIDGTLKARSHRQDLYLDAPDAMFAGFVETIKTLAPKLHPGWTYRGEVLARPKHNTITYQRVPVGHIMIFDVNTAEETYLSVEKKWQEAYRLGLECVPFLGFFSALTVTTIEELLTTESVLGGSPIEGVVIKPDRATQFGEDGKLLMAKYVSERFKEVNKRQWKTDNPTHRDILTTIGESLATEARWQKAIQRGQEDGWLEHDPRDIGRLIKSIQEDTMEEEHDAINEALYRWASGSLRRSTTRGFPEWYKKQLLQEGLAP